MTLSAQPLPDAHLRQEALRFLFDRIDYERGHIAADPTREFKLDRMRELLDRLGQPAATVPIVHIAGSKGKGSTAAMVAAVLTAAGLRTGRFTSPHLERVEERMAVDGLPATATEFVACFERVRPAVEAMDRAAGASLAGPTYFEITTAMALVHFARRRVEAAVLEVGMGGRLDATNVCRPQICAITSISLDHTKQLGDTLGAIAGEKAGIVKPGVPLVSGVCEDEPREVIREICRRRAAPLLELDVDFGFRYRPPRHLEQAPAVGRLDFLAHGPRVAGTRRGLALGLPGSHQAANAAVALAVIGDLAARGWPIPAGAVRQGLAGIAWPARCEVAGRRPAVVIDAAHNTASVAALAATLEESFSVSRRILVFATTREKDIRGMLAVLLPCFDEVVFTRYWNNPRGVPPEELAALAADQDERHHSVIEDPAEAWRQARAAAGPQDLICVTGSFFIAAEVRRLLQAASTAG